MDFALLLSKIPPNTGASTVAPAHLDVCRGQLRTVWLTIPFLKGCGGLRLLQRAAAVEFGLGFRNHSFLPIDLAQHAVQRSPFRLEGNGLFQFRLGLGEPM
jgi:hypothetical protein